MRLKSVRRAPSTTPPAKVSQTDWLVAVTIVGAGVVCFALLLWGHLGLSAWLHPPAPTATQLVTTAGPYAVTARLASGQLTAGGPNSVVLAVRDHAGYPLTNVKIEVRATMTTMAMDAPAIPVRASANGQFLANPRFGMAGTWRLDVIITAPGQMAQHASFSVSVRWG
jgi:hypothetical protein